MLTVKIIDTLWATRKLEKLTGTKFIIGEVIGGTEEGRRLIAADRIGVGIGERAIVTTGSSARKALGDEDMPIDAVVIGIIDEDCPL